MAVSSDNRRDAETQERWGRRISARSLASAKTESSKRLPRLSISTVTFFLQTLAWPSGN